MAASRSLPVLWAEDGGPSVAGKAVLDRERLRLDGGSRKHPRSREIHLTDVVSVHIGRTPTERIGGRAAVQLRLRGGGTVALATLAATMLHELAEHLWAATGTVPEPGPDAA